MKETRIRSPNVGAAYTLTYNLPLDDLGPWNATEGTDPSNDASNESLGILMPSNTGILLPSDNTAEFSTLLMDLIEDPPALLVEINNPVVVAVYESDENLEDILHAAAGKEGPQYFDKDEVIAAGAPGQNVPQAQVVAASVNVPVPISAAELKKLKNDQLFHQLTICGVTFEKAKTKAELSKMLGESLHLPVDGVKAGTKKSIQLSGFPVSVYWRQLDPADIFVETINLTFQLARSPTAPENETGYVPIKHNFSETFERNNFLGKVSTPKRMKNGQLRQDDKGSPTKFEDVEVKKGCVNTDFFLKHGLNATSEPVDWVEDFWPRKNDLVKFSVANFTTNCNLKAHMMQAGEGGITYPKFEYFSVDKVQKSRGLSPTPQVSMKFKSQMQDPINGNYFIAIVMYPNVAERWRHYKALFAIQYPRKATPD